MQGHQPILPAQAIELVEAKGLPDAKRLLADFAAAGLIKTYALARETSSKDAQKTTVRDAQIPSSLWQRIVSENKVVDALNGGTVALQGSELRQGTPAVQITGVSFSEGSLRRLLDRYCTTPMQAASSTSKSASKSVVDQVENEIGRSSADHRTTDEEISQIRPDDLYVSIKQAVQTTGLSRTKINDLMNVGKLERIKVGRRTLITVDSIKRLSD